MSEKLRMMYPFAVALVLALCGQGFPQENKWWATAYPMGSDYSYAYGVAWNAATLDDAKRLAVEACEKQTGGHSCYASLGDIGANECFAILRMQYPGGIHFQPANPRWFHGGHAKFHTEDAARSGAEEEIGVWRRRRNIPVSIDHVACSGTH